MYQKIFANAGDAIKKFQDKTFVIKYGGSIMKNAEAKVAFIEDVVGLNKAEKFILLTHVAGIYEDIDDPRSFISKIDVEGIKRYIQCKKIVGGMITKMECCIHAIENGVHNVHLIDGRKRHGLLLNMLNDEGLEKVCQKIIS